MCIDMPKQHNSMLLVGAPGNCALTEETHGAMCHPTLMLLLLLLLLAVHVHSCLTCMRSSGLSKLASAVRPPYSATSADEMTCTPAQHSTAQHAGQQRLGQGQSCQGCHTNQGNAQA
jgi:hypothetical protein